MHFVTVVQPLRASIIVKLKTVVFAFWYSPNTYILYDLLKDELFHFKENSKFWDLTLEVNFF